MEGNQSGIRFWILSLFRLFGFSHLKIKIMKGPLKNWEEMTALPVAVLGRGLRGKPVNCLIAWAGSTEYLTEGIVLTPIN